MWLDRAFFCSHQVVTIHTHPRQTTTEISIPKKVCSPSHYSSRLPYPGQGS